MSRRRFAGFGLAFVLVLASLTAGLGPALNAASADDTTPKNNKATKKPTADQNKDHKSKGTKKKSADKQQKKPADADVNRLNLEYKALRALRNIEATPEQLSEIARLAKTTVAKGDKREPAKAANSYVDT